MISIVYAGAILSGRITNCESLYKLACKTSVAMSYSCFGEKFGDYELFVFPSRLPSISDIPQSLQNECIKMLLHQSVVCDAFPCKHRYDPPLVAGLKASRQNLYRKADGVVFVVDSLPEKMYANIEAWEEIQPILAERNLPMVLQYNKRDMARATPVETLRRTLNPDRKFPEFPASAVHGQGVWETLVALLQLIAVAKKQKESSLPMTEIDIEKSLREALSDLSRVRIAGLDEPQQIACHNPGVMMAAIRDLVAVYLQINPKCEVLIRVEAWKETDDILIAIVVSPKPLRITNTLPQQPLPQELLESLEHLRTIVQSENGQFNGKLRESKIAPDNENSTAIWFPRSPNCPKPQRSWQDTPPTILPWNELYRWRLAHHSWDILRHEVYRFAREVEQVIAWAQSHGLNTVLCPAVGLCVDPWLFAHAGFNVIANDIAVSALEILAKPELTPQLYSTNAKELWDIEMTMMYRRPHPHTFKNMPALENSSYQKQLASKIQFLTADAGHLSLAANSVDVIFACNALPRGQKRERRAVLKEWLRILKPQGLVFIRMHNDYQICSELRNFLLAAGLQERSVYSFEPDQEGDAPQTPFWANWETIGFLGKFKKILGIKAASPKLSGYFQVVGSSG